jgi:UDP-GlcNAc3NAcA epimerase
VENLQREGFALNNEPPYTIDNPKVYHCGDIMYDNSLHFAEIAETKTNIINKLGLKDRPFILATIHRDTNTDYPERLDAIFSALLTLSEQYHVVLPLHPRTNKLLKTNLEAAKQEQLFSSPNISIIPPVSFLEMIALERHAHLVMTDSGGVQKEAYFFKKPCIILRPETEWVEIVQTGNAILADANESRIMQAWQHFKDNPPTKFPEIFGDGHAAEFILNEMLQQEM